MPPALPAPTPGFETVAVISPVAGRPRPGAAWVLERRPGRTRLRAGEDLAWEFDPEDRLVVEERAGRHREFTLDQRAWGRRVIGHGPERRLRVLAPESDARPRIARAHRVARALAEAVRAGTRELAARSTEAALSFLDRIGRWDAAALADDLHRWREILRPVPVLPPDLYDALPVQLTEGCAWDRCHFCSLYRGVPYRESTVEELAERVDRTLDHLGESRRRFRKLFLGQANALLLGDDALHARLDVLDRRFPRPPAGCTPAEARLWIDDHPGAVFGFGAFVDAFHRGRTASGWRALGDRGLLRVHVGVESGSPDLLRELGKPSPPGAVERLVESLHAGGVPVGLIFLSLDDERARRHDHVEASRRLLARLGLRRGDQVYVSPLLPDGKSAATAAAARAATRMRESLRGALQPGIPVAIYDLHLLAARTPRA